MRGKKGKEVRTEEGDGRKGRENTYDKMERKYTVEGKYFVMKRKGERKEGRKGKNEGRRWRKVGEKNIMKEGEKERRRNTNSEQGASRRSREYKVHDHKKQEDQESARGESKTTRVESNSANHLRAHE